MAYQYIFVLVLSDVFLSVRLHECGVRRDILEQFGKLLGISVYKGIKVGEQIGHMVLLWTTMTFPDCAQFSISLLRTSHRLKQTLVGLFIPRGPSGFFQTAPWTVRGREREKMSPSHPRSHPWALPKSRQEGSICHSWLARCTSKLLGGSKSLLLTNIWGPWWRKGLRHRCSAVRSTSPSMPWDNAQCHTPRNLLEPHILSTEHSVFYKLPSSNAFVDRKTQRGLGVHPQRNPMQRGNGFSDPKLICPHWTMPSHHGWLLVNGQTAIAAKFFLVFSQTCFVLWALTAPPTPPYVTHSGDTYTMRGEERGQVRDPGGSGIPDSVCSSRPQIAPFSHSQSEHQGISPCQGIREEIITICLAQLIDTRPLFLRGISEGAKPKKVKRNDQRTWMTWMSQKTRRAETIFTLGSPRGGNLPASPVTTPSLKTEFIIIMEFGLICHPAPRGTSRVTQVLPLLV